MPTLPCVGVEDLAERFESLVEGALEKACPETGFK